MKTKLDKIIDIALAGTMLAFVSVAMAKIAFLALAAGTCDSSACFDAAMGLVR